MDLDCWKSSGLQVSLNVIHNYISLEIVYFSIFRPFLSKTQIPTVSSIRKITPFVEAKGSLQNAVVRGVINSDWNVNWTREFYSIRFEPIFSDLPFIHSHSSHSSKLYGQWSSIQLNPASGYSSRWSKYLQNRKLLSSHISRSLSAAFQPCKTQQLPATSSLNIKTPRGNSWQNCFLASLGCPPRSRWWYGKKQWNGIFKT